MTQKIGQAHIMPPNSYFLGGKVLEVGQDQQFADLPFRPRLQLTVQGKPSSNERSSVQEDWQIVGYSLAAANLAL